MSDYTKEELEDLSTKIQKAIMDLFAKKYESFERIPQTEDGMKEIIRAVEAVLPPIDYEITVEPQTPEDRRLGRVPRITLKMPNWMTIGVEVKK